MPNTPSRVNNLRQMVHWYCQGTGAKRTHGMLGFARNMVKKYIGARHSPGISEGIGMIWNGT